MAYALAADVETYLGKAFQGDQEDAATALVAAASSYVDRVAGRTWVSGTITGEVRTVWDGQIRLSRVPVTSVASVVVRTPRASSAPVTLTAGTTYDILDATRGILAVNAWDGSLATVTYTAAPTVPDDIKQVVVMLAAQWLSVALSPSGLTLSKLEAGTAKLTFRDDEIPARAKAILDAYRAALAFA
jgi:hypothetical protein